MEVSDFVWRKHSRALAAFSVDPAVMYSLSSRTYSNNAVQVFAARRPGRKTSNRSTPAPGWVTFRNETCRLANKIASFTFPNASVQSSIQVFLAHTGNLRTTTWTSLSGKLRSLSWAAIVPSAKSEEWPILPLSLSSVRSVASVASSWRSAYCQAERLTSVQLSLLHALVAFIRRTGRVRSRRARSEVRWTAPMGIVGWREDVFVSRDLC